MARARDLGTPADWPLRSKHNRALPDGDTLWDSVLATEPLGEIRFNLPARKGQKARPVHQQVHAKRVRIRVGRDDTIEASCVIAREIDPPAGVKVLEWRLLNWYRARWEIELFFHVLKNGCKVEALQLSTFERLERALMLFMVVLLCLRSESPLPAAKLGGRNHAGWRTGT